MLFESRSALIALIAFTAACSGSRVSGSHVSGSHPRAASTAEARGWVELSTTDSDAWARERALRGRASSACARLVVRCRDEAGSCSAGEVARSGETFETPVALGPGANELVARCELEGGGSIESDSVVWRVPPELDGIARTPAPPGRSHAPAPWIESAVVYGAVPHLFAERDGLRAIEARLDALRAVGIDTIWLAPIHPSPEGDYGYAVLDHFAVRDDVGGIEALRSLVTAAHARGMRVLMDFVPNHVSSEHPYFVHAEANGERSPYWGFFERDEDGEPTHYFDWEHLPNLDYDHPEVQAMMRAAFAYWVRELDVDGFRIDAAWGVLARAPGFFRSLADELYAIDPDLLLIAEASVRDRAWGDSGFAAAYDWTDEIGHWAWQDAFAEPGDVDVASLRASLTAASSSVSALRFVDNNDTAERFRSRRGARAYGAATAMLFALPGIPALFTGDEVGAEYLPYEQLEPLALGGVPQGDAEQGEAEPEGQGQGAALARRIALRRAEPLLRRGELAMVDVEPSDGVLAFVRRDPARRDPPLLVVVELDGRATRVRLRLAPEDARRLGLAAADDARATIRDLLAEERVRVDRRGDVIELSIAAHGARVLAR